ncbi:hypothetical protein EYF80_047220 [Liparis tanakae]|uniref:Uncharacterized protein n=1 Tax=Liparis tanakae TaxID=230148 RepID=A0A4Z2FN68_9TELE|nr:hypothetical protein EYF80_047220 [Liparis tanakae]
MADPLRRTLLAKLRGKKSKKGAATVGGGGGGGHCCSTAAAAAANGGREGKEKVSQTQLRDPDEALPVVVLAGLDCTAERMSTYENCVDGATAVRTEAAVVAPERRASSSSAAAAELSGARPQERSGGGGGGRVRVNEEPPGVSLQRDVRGSGAGGHGCGDADRSHRGPGSAALCAGPPLGGPHVQRKRYVSVPRQCSVGDSIGFGDNSNHVLHHRAQVEPHAHGLGKPPEGRASAAAVVVVTGDGTEPRDGAPCRRHAAAAVAVNEHNANRSVDSLLQTSETSARVRAEPPEDIVIRTIESYGPEYAGDFRGTAGGPQSPTFFPTQLDICDINVASLCATAESLRYTLGSEDEDYYDNEILPFYESIRAKGDGEREMAEPPQPGQGKEHLDGGNSAQETDRLRVQLKEAYYLLINAMNDINLDVQQMSGGPTERQAASSCSSRSRDSLCSRLSAKNMDSDSWSSGGDRSPQQVSDADSLLCGGGGENLEPGLGGGRPKSKSLANLCPIGRRPALRRSASEGAVGRSGGPSPGVQNPGGPEKGAAETEGAARGRSEPPGPGADEILPRGVGEVDGSGGSADSLAGSSSDGVGDASANRGEREPVAGARARSSSVSKGHGVTVNKMQEWMHRGRLLSSEMKQRIEGSAPPPRGGGQNQDPPAGSKPTSVRGVKCVKVKSQQQQQQPGRTASSTPPWIL